MKNNIILGVAILALLISGWVWFRPVSSQYGVAPSSGLAIENYIPAIRYAG